MDPRGFNLRYVAEHLAKFREILDASKQKLPQLQSIELNLHSIIWGEDKWTRILAKVINGELWVEWADVKIGYRHKFLGDRGEAAENSDEDEDEDDGNTAHLENDRRNIDG